MNLDREKAQHIINAIAGMFECGATLYLVQEQDGDVLEMSVSHGMTSDLIAKLVDKTLGKPAPVKVGRG